MDAFYSSSVQVSKITHLNVLKYRDHIWDICLLILQRSSDLLLDFVFFMLFWRRKECEWPSELTEKI